jgi:hypothetical protein
MGRLDLRQGFGVDVVAITCATLLGIGLLALRTDTLFTPAPKEGTGVSIYLSIYLLHSLHVQDAPSTLEEPLWTSTFYKQNEIVRLEGT